MNKTVVFLTLFLSLTLVFAFAAPPQIVKNQTRQAFTEKASAPFNAAEYLKAQRDRFDWLMSESVSLSPDAIISVSVLPSELEEMENYQCESCGKNQKLLIGLTKPVNTNVAFTHLRDGYNANGMLQSAPDGGYVWTVAAESKDAVGIRIHLTNFNLPASAELYVYNMDGEAFGPYTDRGPNGDGDFWTNSVSGSIAYLQLRQYGEVAKSDLAGTHFNIAHVGHLGPKFKLPFLKKPNVLPTGVDSVESICSFNAPCVEDASCYNVSAVADAKNAIAQMQYISGAYIYYCSGGLLADTDTSSQVPYFLTADHCISRDSQASSLECYWFFATSNCGGACYDPVGAVPRTLGATILSHSSKNGDYCLLQLNETPPTGTVYMGWYADPVAYNAGYVLHRISHPGGAPQAYSKTEVDATVGDCRSWPRGKWIYSQDIIGATEGGSSGSPVVNASGQVVGQLSGACGYNTADPCDSESNSTVDGALAAYFTEVEEWLDPVGGPVTGGTETHVDAIVLSIKAKGKKVDGIANITVKDENGDPVADATVTGTFSGDFSGSLSGTTDADGTVEIKAAGVKGAANFTFCVTNITHATMTYDSASNVETCDSL